MTAADVGLVIVAAGSGSRLGADAPKAFVPLAGVPILGHALRGALSCPDLREVVVVAPPAWLGPAQEVCRSAGFAVPADPAPTPLPSSGPGPAALPWNGANRAEPEVSARTDGYLRASGQYPSRGHYPSKGHNPTVTVVAGGAERGESVAAGLAALSGGVHVVLVHDAARCLAPSTVFARVIEAVRGGAAAAVPGVPVVDTIKEVDACGRVVGTPDRSRLRAVQTPQAFSRAVLERAHAVTSDATDDAALVERLGEPVIVVPGDERALKITTREDLDRAARILAG